MHMFCCWIPCRFHVLLANNATVSAGGKGPPKAFWCFCFSSDIYPGVDLLDHSSRFGFLRNLHIVFQSSCSHLPSHQQGSYSPCCLHGCTHSAQEAPGRPPALRPAQGAGCVWPRPGLPSTPAELVATREASPPVWSPFLRVPPGHQTALLLPSCWFCVALCYSLGCKPFCSFPVTPQWDLFRCRCMCLCGARWVLARGFLLCHSSRNSSYK